MKKIFLMLLLISSYNYSQELNCTVIVNYQNVPVKNRELLVDFKNVVENYIISRQEIQLYLPLMMVSGHSVMK
jgi:hypothetical protein